MDNNNNRKTTYRVMCRTEHWYAQYDLRFPKGENRMLVQEYPSKEEADWKLLQLFNEAAAGRSAGPFKDWDEAVGWTGATSLLRAEGQRRDGSRGFRDRMYSFYTEERKAASQAPCRRHPYRYYDKNNKR